MRWFNKFAERSFLILVILALLTPWWVSKELLFPFVTSKAFFFRIVVELALPLYVYLIASQPDYRPGRKNYLTWAVVAFFLASLISALFGVNVSRSLWGNFERMGGVYYLLHLTLFYFYLLLVGKISARWMRLVLNWQILAAALLTLNGLLAKWLYVRAAKPALPGADQFVWALNFFKWDFNHLGILFDKIADPSLPGRISATLGNPIFLGSFLVIPLFLALFLASREEKRWKKICYYLAAILQFLGIVQSGTRGAIVGLAAGIFAAVAVYLWLAKNKKIKIYGSALLSVFTAVVFLLFIFSAKLPEGSPLRRAFHLRDSNTVSRVIQWKVALKGFLDYPLLGTGPENYYVIANQHYNPELYKYDASWFDKPHNYPLEILTTTGFLGFAFFAAVILGCLFALWLAFRRRLIDLTELCLLFCGFIVYQVQNLFVFDTVPASLVFFLFVGFAGFLWEESEAGGKAEKKSAIKDGLKMHPAFSFAVFGLTFIFCGYAVYGTNIMPIRASKNVNYGYAYGSVDAAKAEKYFQTALSLPFNFDLSESGSKYQEFVLNLVQSGGQNLGRERVSRILDFSLNNMVFLAETTGNNPALWQKLAALYLAQAFWNQSALNPRAEPAAARAVELAPKRVEARGALLQIYLSQGRSEQAASAAEEIAKTYPSGYNQWQLAAVYKAVGKLPEALKIYEQLLAEHYKFQSLDQLAWVIAHYESRKDFIAAIKWYEAGAKLNLFDLNFYVKMAQAYFLSGQPEKARELAANIIKTDPAKEKELKSIIK